MSQKVAALGLRRQEQLRRLQQDHSRDPKTHFSSSSSTVSSSTTAGGRQQEEQRQQQEQPGEGTTMTAAAVATTKPTFGTVSNPTRYYKEVSTTPPRPRTTPTKRSYFTPPRDATLPNTNTISQHNNMATNMKTPLQQLETTSTNASSALLSSPPPRPPP